MLTKILLVAALILLSWNYDLINAQIQSNQNLIQTQTKELKKYSDLSKSNSSIIKKITAIDDSIAKDIKKNSSDLITAKAVIEKIKSSLDKQTSLLVENKKVVDLINKSNSEIKGLLWKQSKNITKYSNSVASLDLCNKLSNCSSKNHVYTKKKIIKPKVVNIKTPTDSESLNKLFYELYKTKAFQKKKQMKEALVQLSKLKSELWKNRDHKNISKELVMSTLSSIDITKNKWENKEINYDVDKIEQKLNRLICKPGVCK